MGFFKISRKGFFKNALFALSPLFPTPVSLTGSWREAIPYFDIGEN